LATPLNSAITEAAVAGGSGGQSSSAYVLTFAGLTSENTSAGGSPGDQGQNASSHPARTTGVTMGSDATGASAGKLSFDDLPMADDRTAAYAILREGGPIARDRRILQPFFSPRAAAPLPPEVRNLAGELIDGFIGSGECDITSDFAIPLPAEVFLTLFGLPVADKDRLIAWKDAILDTAGIRGAEEPSPESAKLGAELFEYLAGNIARRRGEGGGEDLLGKLLADTSDDRLTDDELLGLSFQFVLAGLDTVTCALSTAFATLATRADLRAQVVTQPQLIPDAVEELLRVDGPRVTLPRVATQDAEIEGSVIPAGSYVQVAVAAANRDPGEHADPDTINLRRRERHIAFGGGPHRCLGSHLARMELRVALEGWHRRIPEYELAAGARPQVTWPAGLAGIDSLPVFFPPGGGPQPTT
jgi:cytochrome P450